jgi:hypothetical protein
LVQGEPEDEDRDAGVLDTGLDGDGDNVLNGPAADLGDDAAEPEAEPGQGHASHKDAPKFFFFRNLLIFSAKPLGNKRKLKNNHRRLLTTGFQHGGSTIQKRKKNGPCKGGHSQSRSIRWECFIEIWQKKVLFRLKDKNSFEQIKVVLKINH